MLGRDGVVLGLVMGLMGCGACSETDESVNTPMSGPGDAVIIGGEASAEGLILAWYEAIASGESGELDLLVLSAEQLIDGLWAKMGKGHFYAIVSPKGQPEDLYKAIVGLHAEDIMYDRPPLSQFAPESRAESRARLEEIRSKL